MNSDQAAEIWHLPRGAFCETYLLSDLGADHKLVSLIHIIVIMIITFTIITLERPRRRCGPEVSSAVAN